MSLDNLFSLGLTCVFENQSFHGFTRALNNESINYYSDLMKVVALLGMSNMFRSDPARVPQYTDRHG